MSDRKSSEIQEIFGLSRDDIKRLERDGILKPQKSGQGKASIFSEDDMNCLLDVKIHLLAGYRICDMKGSITDDYDSDIGITEQIHLYKKRIQMLEFVQKIRADRNELDKLSDTQRSKFLKTISDKTKTPIYGSKEYFDYFWKIMKLIFIVDFLSQKQSFKEKNSTIVLDRAYKAYQILVELLKISGAEITDDDINSTFIEIANTSDCKIRELVNEIVDEYLSNREEILEKMLNEGLNPIINELDVETGNIYRQMLSHLYQFVLDYFVDEQELDCILLNIKKFVHGLDENLLKEGLFRLGAK